MASCVSLFYIIFTVELVLKSSTGVPQLELGVYFVDEPRDVVGIKGKSLALPCRTQFARQKEFFDIKWYHDNKEINFTNDKRRTILQNGTLYFSKLVHKKSGQSDQGEYRCVVVKENGSLSSKPGFLRISVLPGNFSRHPKAQNVTVGSNVQLFCEIECTPELKIEWEKDGIKLPQNLLKYATVSGPDVQGSVLYIFNLVPDDSGSYRCSAKNIILNKYRHSSSGLITVLPQESNFSHKPLTFLLAKESASFLRYSKEGDNVTLYCVSNGYPTPVLMWSFLQYGQNKSRSVFNATSTGYNIVEIKNVTRSQAGWYTCSILNFSKKELTTQLKVMTSPKIQEKSDSIVFRASRTVRFRCVAFGEPIPEIFWLKDGVLVNITGRVKHRIYINESMQIRYSELIVSSSIANDAGIYQCMAKNSIGSTWAAIRLFLNATEPAPGAPERVICESLSSSQIKLTWDIPNAVNEVIAFSVHYHLTENGEEMQKVMPSSSRSIEIDKLLPYTNYTFYIRLYIDSASEFSEKAVCQTKEEVPIEAPQVKLKIIGPNSVHISWFPLSKDKARGVVIQYKIQWRVTKSRSSKVDQVTSDVFDYIITDLMPGKTYDVRVLAATNKGWPSSDLPWYSFETPLSYNLKTSLTPEVFLRALNSSSIEVTWSLENPEVYGYKIFYRKQNSNQMGPLSVSADINQYIISGLDPETWYEIMVLSLTKEEDEGSGIKSVHTLSLEEPSKKINFNYSSTLEPPFSLEADPISSGTINLTWNSRRNSSGFSKINYYTVCYNAVQTSRNKNASVHCLKSPTNKISVVGLKPYTLYEFKVKSHDMNEKQSMFSQVVECQTLEDVPSQVIDVSTKALNKTAVQVTWKEPRQSNGIIKNYTLYYSQDSHLPLNLWKMKAVAANYLRTELTDLTSNVRYYLIIRASTSAGFGLYGFPNQLLIPSPKIVSVEEERDPKTVKNKQSDHYIGIMVGLGIGLCCIILCTVCILCRRRCLKRQVSQEFEITSSRYSNGNNCQRNRELAIGSQESEYFTFLSLQNQRSNTMETSVRYLDTKGMPSNGSVNGLKMSLLSEGRGSNNNSKKINIYITENPRYDPNYSDSPLLNTKIHSVSSNRSSEVAQETAYKSDFYDELEDPLISSQSGNTDKSFNISRNPDLPKEKKLLSNYSKSRSSLEYPKHLIVENNIGIGNVNRKISCKENQRNQKFNESENWLENNILSNPNFTFSDSNSSLKIVKRKNGYILPNNISNSELDSFNGLGSKEGNLDTKNHNCGIYKKPSISLNRRSTEIIQES